MLSHVNKLRSHQLTMSSKWNGEKFECEMGHGNIYPASGFPNNSELPNLVILMPETTFHGHKHDLHMELCGRLLCSC